MLLLLLGKRACRSSPPWHGMATAKRICAVLAPCCWAMRAPGCPMHGSPQRTHGSQFPALAQWRASMQRSQAACCCTKSCASACGCKAMTENRMSLFSQIPEESTLKRARTAPLAERMRPRALEEYVGQEQLLGPGMPLRMEIERDGPASMILWGPPGVGKTI